jgi:hypothetical protein
MMRTASMAHRNVVVLHTGGEREPKDFGEATAKPELAEFIWGGRI